MAQTERKTLAAYTPTGASSALNVSGNTIRTWLANGRLEPVWTEDGTRLISAASVRRERRAQERADK